MREYKRSLVELDEVLKYLSKEEYAKIPEDILEAIKENKDKEYTWEYDETKKLKEQNLMIETVAFLSYLNMEYLLNDEQRELMEQFLRLNEEKQKQKQKLFQEKQNNINSERIFNKESIEEGSIQEEIKPIVDIKEMIVKQPSLLTRIKNFFKKMF